MTRVSVLVMGIFALAGCVAASSGATTGRSSSSAVPGSPDKAGAASGEELEAEITLPSDKTSVRGGSKPEATAGRHSRSKANFDGKTETQQLMGNHFGEADLIRIAVIAGRLADAIKPAHKLLYASEVESLPVTWKGAVQRMQDSAERLKGSNDMVMAAASTADIGTSCGYCHQRLGGPTVPQLTPPSSDRSVEGRMAQHVWATERLWEGLYVPSLDAWNAGMEILSSAPFPDEVFQQRGMYARTAADDFARIVARAPRKAGAEAQAETYAALLATCATCHLAVD